VLEILSHDSAEISDEVRNLREGVLYGFFFFAVSAFPVSASHVFSVEALSASIDPPIMNTGRIRKYHQAAAFQQRARISQYDTIDWGTSQGITCKGYTSIGVILLNTSEGETGGAINRWSHQMRWMAMCEAARSSPRLNAPLQLSAVDDAAIFAPSA